MSSKVLDVQVQIVKHFYTILFRNYYLTQHLEQFKLKLYKLPREIADDYTYIEWESYIDEFKYIEWENIDFKVKNFEELYKLCRQYGECQIDIYEANIQEFTTVNYLISSSSNDNEWLFIFQDNGKLLTVRSKYQEIVLWAETSLVDKFLNADELLKTYWGTGLPGFREICQQSLARKSLIIEYKIEDIETLLQQNLNNVV